MVAVVEHVHQVGVERVDVVQLWEAFDDSSQLFIDRLLHEFDFAHVEFADPLNLEALANLGRRLALRLREHNVDQIVGLWDLDNLLEVVGTCCHWDFVFFINNNFISDRLCENKCCKTEPYKQAFSMLQVAHEIWHMIEKLSFDTPKTRSIFSDIYYLPLHKIN